MLFDILDILSTEIPIILRKEIYATACIVGGASFLGLTKVGASENLTYLSTASIIILIRVLAIKYNLSLPSFYKKKQLKDQFLETLRAKQSPFDRMITIGRNVLSH